MDGFVKKPAEKRSTSKEKKVTVWQTKLCSCINIGAREKITSQKTAFHVDCIKNISK